MSDDDKLALILHRMDEHDKQAKVHIDETREWRKKMEERLGKTEEQLFLYKTVIRVLKGLGMIAVLILTLKFGDIMRYLKGM